MAGALVKRHKWYTFRRRFYDLRLSPILDYSSYCKPAKEGQEPLNFRFLGSLESVTDGETLWLHGKDITIPIYLKNAETYLLPAYKGGDYDGGYNTSNMEEETPVKIRWGRVSTLTEGAKVFVGGSLVYRDERWQFISTKKNPLIVIFYDGPDRLFAARVIQSCREQWEYWNNPLTPYSLIVGALCLILLAFSFLHRPVFRPTVIVSFVSLFIPLYPIIPPGLLFTVLCRRLAWKSRMFKAYSDLALLPPPPETTEAENSKEPESPKETLAPKEPMAPHDPLPAFGIFPDASSKLARKFMVNAYALEVLTWILLLTGIGLNIAFILGIVLILL